MIRTRASTGYGKKTDGSKYQGTSFPPDPPRGTTFPSGPLRDNRSVPISLNFRHVHLVQSLMDLPYYQNKTFFHSNKSRNTKYPKKQNIDLKNNIPTKSCPQPTPRPPPPPPIQVHQTHQVPLAAPSTSAAAQLELESLGNLLPSQHLSPVIPN